MRSARALTVGDSAPPRVLGPLTRTDIVRFAGAGGDFNPLHHDDAVAQAAGFDTVIAMGQYQAGLLAAVLSDWVGVEHVRRFAVRFASPLRLGDVLEVAGTVVAASADSVEIQLSGTVAERTVITATATVRAVA